MSSYVEAAVLGRLGSSQMQRKTGAGKPFLTLSIASAGQGEAGGMGQRGDIRAAGERPTGDGLG